MTEVKTADLIGPALDWAVAEAIEWKEPIFCVGLISYIEEEQYLMMEKPDPDEPDEVTKPHHFNHYEQWAPSRIWSQGGPMIDSFMIDVTQCPGRTKTHKARAVMDSSFLDKMGLSQRVSASGPTALIATCRAIVAAKLGDVVSVPSELLEVSA